MKISLSHILLIILLPLSSLESFGQQILSLDTAIVDVLAVFYCSGDANAVEKNHFGMVLLEGSSGLDKLLPITECGYRYYKSNHKIVNVINDKMKDCFIANIRLGNADEVAIFLGLLNKEFIPGTRNHRPKVMARDTTSLYYDLLQQLWNNQPELGYINREKCYYEPFFTNAYNTGISSDYKFDFREGYYYQLHKYRMAYLLMQDENDSVLRLAYYNPLGPTIFPGRNPYDMITTAGEPITFSMHEEYDTHIHKYMKDGVSLVAVPYMFEYIDNTSSKSQSKSKTKSKSKRKKRKDSENYFIIL